MPVYHLAPKQAVRDAMAAGQPVGDRLIAAMTSRGYVIGEGGVQIDPLGNVTIDVDHDPTVDWEAFNPTAHAEAEIATSALRQQVIDGLAVLAADEAILKGSPAPSAAQVRDAVLHLNQGMQRLVKAVMTNGAGG